MKLLGRVDVCDVQYSVYEARATEKGCSVLEGCYGVCQPFKTRILIEAGMPPDIFMSTLMHELLHALWHECGFLWLLNNYKGQHREEIALRMWSPHLIRMLKSMRQLNLKERSK